MRFYYNTDTALMAGGTMRGDQIYPAGIIKLGDIISCFPFEDPCVVIRVSGKHLWAALENSVSKLPALEGRFCQVSGIEFGYNPSADEDHRVRYVKIKGEDIELEERYTVATRGYMARGKDGFESLRVDSGDVEYVINEEHGVLISMIVRQYFLSLKVVSRWKRGGHICGLFAGLRRKQVDSGHLAPKPAIPEDGDSTEWSDAEDELTEKQCSPIREKSLDLDEDARLFELKRRIAMRWERITKMGRNIRRNGAGDVGIDWCRSVRPQIEGRINIVTT